jgi:hypothetical protein
VANRDGVTLYDWNKLPTVARALMVHDEAGNARGFEGGRALHGSHEESS